MVTVELLAQLLAQLLLLVTAADVEQVAVITAALFVLVIALVPAKEGALEIVVGDVM